MGLIKYQMFIKNEILSSILKSILTKGNILLLLQERPYCVTAVSVVFINTGFVKCVGLFNEFLSHKKKQKKQSYLHILPEPK